MNAPVSLPERALRPLRPHQQQAFEELRRFLLEGKTRPLLQMPTGAGKTLLAAHVIRGALGKGKRVAFIAPALSLIDQTVADFENEGISAIGVMQGIHERTEGPRDSSSQRSLPPVSAFGKRSYPTPEGCQIRLSCTTRAYWRVVV
jgi:superfamily II DNA or RNA helicase